MILCISVASVALLFFSFLTLWILALSLFFLMSLAKGLSSLFFFPKNQLLVSLIFSIFFSLYFIPALIFMISFLQLPLGFVCSYFYSSFTCKFRLFI